MLDHVGRRAKEIRNERGWTQEELAERMGVLPQYVQRIEGGRENLTLGSLVKLANALDARPSEFFEEPADLRPRRPGRPRSS